jgi:uncharacterized membrane protein YdjX (TVP38/TMEM64 family)
MHTEASPQPKSRRQTVISLVMTLLLIALLILLLRKEMSNVRDFIRNSGWIGLLVSIILYGLLGFTPIPSEPLTIMLSTIYGPLPATFVSGTGNLLAAMMEYYLGTHLGNIGSFEERRHSLPFGLGKLPVSSPLFLLGVRMIPGYGPKFVSLLGGIYRVPKLRYIWTAAIPTFLGAAIFAYGGFGIINTYILHK